MFTFAESTVKEMCKDVEIQGNMKLPTDPANNKGLNPYQGQGCDFKKCCKKYKKGDRCKKCPKR
jgi:hypothetical protein